MSDIRSRIDLLATQSGALLPWLGEFDEVSLFEWVEKELGSAEALDCWVACGPIHTKAVALSPVLHVVSGNTPHAAFQSVFRGLILGCRNLVKLPSAGLPEFEKWVAELPAELRERIELRHELPEEWLTEAEAAVIFGGAETMEIFRNLMPAHVRMIEHGPKLSIAVVFTPTEEAARRVAEDVLRFDQRGCLSVQAVYAADPQEFGDLLAAALAEHRARHPRGAPTLSESGAVTNLRELARFREANGEPLRLWESPGSTEWTVLYDPDPRLAPGPLNGFATLHPIPERLDRETLGTEAAYLSTVALHPFGPETAARLEALAPPRICEAGRAQEPTIFWHHDGLPPLASLVRWRDLG